MYDFKEHAILFNRILMLSAEEKINPIMGIRHFFEDHHLHEVRQHIWNLFEAAIASDNDLFMEAIERNKLLAFYSQLEKLIKAAYLLQKE